MAKKTGFRASELGPVQLPPEPKSVPGRTVLDFAKSAKPTPARRTVLDLEKPNRSRK